ncbi:hypothetical protein ACT3CD_01240 [Geofilum sp. OHC36d9]|uniref:hypothetical protein n=1 Tax=Geofilum sp. OHC36d9 TaxID=3458413 RepID=UPI004033AB65
MKKIYLAYIAAFLIVACDPIEDRDQLEGNVAVTDLDLSVDPIVENGLTTNSFIVENNSPLLSRWITDREQIQNSYCTISCNTAGDQEVKFVGLNGDGSFLEQLFPIYVDTMVNLPANVKARLGIEYADDGSVDKTSAPYFWGKADYTIDVDYEISITQEKDGDVLGNKLTIDCGAPYLCNWTFGTAVADKNKCDIFVTSTGTFTLSLNLTKSDGTVIENAFVQDFEVEKLTYVPQVLFDLFGDFVANPDTSKTWQWARKGKVWANGPLRGFTDPGSGWWQNEYADMVARQDGEMTFEFSDLSLTKVVTGGDETIDAPGEYKGGVVVDLGTKTEGYSVGTIKLDGITILNGVDVNDGNKAFVEVSLVKASANTLILGGDSDGTGQTWLYKFENANPVE